MSEILSIGDGRSGKDTPLRHVYSRGDDAGISLVLYIHSENLFQAEASARELLERAIDTSESLTGWTIAHCAADLISQAMDRIIGSL
ncbi:hypothetical protein [Sphaerimonospora thailandensis]|nr:hypothetical protein [Sphaerimonospora thailandensis]